MARGPGKRGLVAYIACGALFIVALRAWAVPYVKRLVAAPKDEGLHGI